MNWVMLYDPPPPRTGNDLHDCIVAEVDALMRGDVIREGPGRVMLASEQHVGLFVRPCLPRLQESR